MIAQHPVQLEAVRLQGIDTAGKDGILLVDTGAAEMTDKMLKAGKLLSTISLEYKTIPVAPPCKKTVDVPLTVTLPGGGIRRR